MNTGTDALIDKLIAARTQIRAALVDLDEAGKPVALDQTTQGRVSRIDAITQQQIAKFGRTHLLMQLERIRAALERHDAGRYGYCCRCELEIEPSRLNADPAAPFCLDCLDGIAEDKARQERMGAMRR